MKKALIKGGVNLLKKAADTEIVRQAVSQVGKVGKQVYDSHQARQSDLIMLPNTSDMNPKEAKALLDSLGFIAHLVPEPKPEKLKSARPNVVLRSVPKSGKHPAGTLVKLYSVTDEQLTQSNQKLTLPDVTGMSLIEAIELLKQAGFRVTTVPLEAKKRHAHKPANHVIAMKPTPGFMHKSISKDSIVKLYYLSEQMLQASQALERTEKEQPKVPRIIAGKKLLRPRGKD